MRTRVIIAITTILILSVSLSLFSSNMAFKLKMQLTGNLSKFISLPCHCQYTTAGLLRNRLISEGGGSVSVYNWNGMEFQEWSGGGEGQVNFDITPGTGYKVVTSQAVDNWLIVGSHDESVVISFTGCVTKYVSIPYHAKAKTAAELRNELIASGASWAHLYNWSGTRWQRWSGGGIGQYNFPIVAGTSYQVQLYPDTNWIPAHY